MKKREVELVVLSDIHLGTYGCHAKELLKYMKSIRPGTVVLNGDIVDIWQFSKRYWPKSHMKVVKKVLDWASQGIPVVYITGNHDEMLRKFTGFELGSFTVVNKLVLELDGRKAWIFHGDVFDVTMEHSRWLARLGAFGYDLLILLNRAVNFISSRLGYGKLSMSKKIKNSVKSAVKFVNNFEQTAADIASDNGYDYVVCGHIHQPEMRVIEGASGPVLYLNSGDWIENLSCLEYQAGSWRIYRFEEDGDLQASRTTPESEEVYDTRVLYQDLIKEFHPKS